MEWCEKIYGEWRSAEGLRRLERAAAVFILLLLAVIGIKDGYAGFPVMEGEYSADPEAGAAGSALSGDRTALPDMIPAAVPGADGILSSVMGNVFESIPGELPVEPEKDVTAEAGTAEVLTEALIPEEQNPSVPEMSLPETAVPVLPEEGTAPDIPAEGLPAEDLPSESIPEESVPENSPENINGFLVDTEGMICGIADTGVISEGYLVLPAEGCSGIRTSAFADVPRTDHRDLYSREYHSDRRGSICMSPEPGMAGGRRIGHLFYRRRCIVLRKRNLYPRISVCEDRKL